MRFSRSQVKSHYLIRICGNLTFISTAPAECEGGGGGGLIHKLKYPLLNPSLRCSHENW